MRQETALSVLKTGVNVFLTGEPGSGKTHTVNQYVEYLRAHDIETAITASTGIAATHIGGYTIHSWSGIGIKKVLDRRELTALLKNKKAVSRIESAKVLIIDEISMLDADTLDTIESVCRAIRKNEKPFGGLQVVLVGDFFQLPPVSKLGEPPIRFAFEAGAWGRAHFKLCYLTEQYRQEDALFLELLSGVRSGSSGEHIIARLSTRMIAQEGTNGANTKLFTHNVDVDRINEQKLAELQGKPRSFVMKRYGRHTLTDQLVRGCLSPEMLVLKEGAEVMCTKNNMEAGFVNGTLGKVIAFEKRSGLPIIQTKKGRRIVVWPMEWSIEERGIALARIVQIPLRLAWAITVHKSQGMSLDAAVVDLSKAFEYGQGYVALSRVRTLTGLFLLGFNARALEVNPAIVERDSIMRRLSEETESAFAALSESERMRREQDFIIACDGSLAGVENKPLKRSRYSTYSRTKELVCRGPSVGATASGRGLTVGTVIAHLEKLVLEGVLDSNRDILHLKPEQERFEKIKTAFEKVYKQTGDMRLAPARELLGDSFGFEELRIARLFVERNRNK